MSTDYDVVILGGGPSGASLATFLAKESKLRVAIYEREFFPREHIGESFSFRVTPLLEEMGCLKKVLDSTCYVTKYGGYYAWGGATPDAKFFAHGSWEKDGVRRWGIHANRSEYDHIILAHARSMGVSVFEGVEIVGFTQVSPGVRRVELSDGTSVTTKILAECSGRMSKIVSGSKRTWLSEYRNIAVWNHFVDCELAQTVPGDWNLYREPNISPLGAFAFEDGWFWYIPVPKPVCGKMTLTHSIGIVTSPEVLKQPGKRYTEMDTFVSKMREVPLLKGLVQNAKPISDKVLTATNYSMISDRMCSYDEGWILVGDSAYFVDPLFSSGVGFAGVMAAGAAAMIRETLESNIPASELQVMWGDYDSEWRSIAISYAFGIDQWYHAIARNNPTSIYWNRRGHVPTFDLREETFQLLLDQTRLRKAYHAVTEALAPARKEELMKSGPFLTMVDEVTSREPELTTRLQLVPNARVEDGLTIQALPDKGDKVPPDKASPELAARYWADPVKVGPEVPPLYLGQKPQKCRRVHAGDRSMNVRYAPSDKGDEVVDLLRTPKTYGEFREKLTTEQRTIVGRLIRNGIVVEAK